MANYLACPCLNIRLHLPSRPHVSTETGTAVETAKQILDELPHHNRPSGWKLTLGLGGVTVEHEALIVVKPAVKHWHTVCCLNCSCNLYAYKEKRRDDQSHGLHGNSNDSITHTRHTGQQPVLARSPPDGTVCVLEHASALAGKEIVNAQQNEQFSWAFKIVIQHCDNEDDIQAEMNDIHALESNRATEKTKATLKDYELTEMAALEQRVTDFRSTQNELLEKRMQRAKEDQTAIIRQLLRADTLRQQALSQSSEESGSTSHSRATSFTGHISSQDIDHQPSSEESDSSMHEIAETNRPSSIVIGSLKQGGFSLLAGLNTTRAERLAQQAPTATRDNESLIEDKQQQTAPILFEKVLPSTASTLTRVMTQDTQYQKGDVLNGKKSTYGNKNTNDYGNDKDEDEDDLFLLDEEADLDDTIDTQPIAGSFRESGSYFGAEQRETNDMISRPGMHFGTSMMPQDSRYMPLSQSMSGLSGSIGTGGWKQRSRHKYLPDFEDDRSLDQVNEEDLSVLDDESRDGLTALRQQTNAVYGKGQSPSETSHHMFATSLPINIHRQPLNQLKKKPANDKDSMNVLPVSSTVTGIAAVMAGSQVNRPLVGGDLYDASNDLDSEDDEFVAPHLLAARTYTESNEAIFGSMPRSSRIHSVAI
ncbi:hypothetical protein BDF19DRAFT_448790 [Syncephalis fuscata]|nr:hypothetical protein BDF19DRAFT_448790 [Syncephalis fuscata]